jgi:hypothetical protein
MIPVEYRAALRPFIDQAHPAPSYQPLWRSVLPSLVVLVAVLTAIGYALFVWTPA